MQVDKATHLPNDIKVDRGHAPQAFQQLRDWLRAKCGPEGRYYPFRDDVPSPSPGIDAYREAALEFLRVGAPSLAESLLVDGWNNFSSYQLIEKRHVPKMNLAQELAFYCLVSRDNAGLFRWSLCSQADAVLGGESESGGKLYLHNYFGLSEVDIERLNKCAKDCRDDASRTEDGWAQPVGFPEEVVRRFFEENPTSLMRWSSDRREFPLSSAYFRALLKYADSCDDPNKKGDALENLASYLLSLLPGCVPRPDLKDMELAGQTDVVVNNLNRVADITVDLLGRNFIVECKNWAKPIGVSQVGYFLHRMQLAHVKFGIIFSNEGITGTKPDTEKAARALIRRTYHENGSLCVVIDNTDLKSLADSEKPSFWTLLLSKIEEFRFGK